MIEKTVGYAGKSMIADIIGNNASLMLSAYRVTETLYAVAAVDVLLKIRASAHWLPRKVKVDRKVGLRRKRGEGENGKGKQLSFHVF